mgnify:CR=1 FL=1
MNQPDLGKKIAELRRAKGLTQEELVEKCNLNVRTLQRIESGEVSPRSYTIRTIFSALEYQIYDSPENNSNSGWRGSTVQKRLEQLYTYLFDLLNLKVNTMKKISILTFISLAGAVLFTTIGNETKAETPAEVKRTIKASNEKFMRLFNAGKIDSLGAFYREDACLIGVGCGKAVIAGFYAAELKDFKLEDLSSRDILVSDTTAIEKGHVLLRSNTGEKLEGEYLTEWRLTNGRWLIFSDRTTFAKEP